MSTRVDELLKTFPEVELPSSEHFLIVKETLERMGIVSKEKMIIYPSCHILHKQGRFYIVHFKNLMECDGKSTDINEKDIARRNTIAYLLERWGLVKVVNRDIIETPRAAVSSIKVIPAKEKSNYTIEFKYQIGKHHDK